MTQMPEDEPISLPLTCSTRPTEMGLEIQVHSQPVNITVELDLDSDPEFFFAITANLTQIVQEQMHLYAQQNVEGFDE